MPFELLRAAAAVSSGGPVAGLPPGMLRLSLEYAQPANVAVERARIADLLGANGFDLQALAEDDTILILQFPGVLRKQSATFLFREADSLVDALGLVSATPDVDPGWIGADELGRDAPESVPGLVAAICESNAPKPHDPLWAVKAVRADQAWAAHGASGAGILVGQPDTGVATHDELVGGVDIAKGVNILTGGGPPIDPLTHAGNPGHGTATSSCVTSRTAGLIAGTAPGAMIVPVRCVNLVVLSSGAAVAAAIDHARNQGCHVITMSLGGPVPFPDLRNAIRRAVKAGMIVLAAAGNCVGLVVYPAWDDDVIAVAGVDEHDRRWKGSSHGSAVDISAPAENVFVARRSTPTDLNLGMVHPGQGTSFAVAITAGVAALWLSRFGVAAVRNQANSHGLTTQTLFRAAVRKTARRPAGWPTDMGAGVVDALALLDLPLDQIFPPPSPPAGPGVPPAGGPLSSPSHHPLRQTLGPNFDWARFGAEAGFLALDRAQREQATRQAALESPVAPRPSPGLVAALRAVELEVTSVLGAPAVVTSPLTPALSPRQAIRIVASSGLVRSGGVENAGAVTETMARAYLSGSGRAETLDGVGRTLADAAARGDADPEIGRMRSRLAEAMPLAVDLLAAGGRVQDFTGPTRVALEALVRMTGRPAFRVQNGALDVATLGDWVSYYAPRRAAFDGILASVGRVDLLDDGRQVHVGTGVVVAPNLIMTNRHVLDAIAEPVPDASGRDRFVLTGEVSLAFDEGAVDPARRFRVTGVEGAGPDRIGQQADIRKLDMAFLEIESTNAEGGQSPPPIQAAEGETARTPILVVGYPARPGMAAVTDPSTNTVSLDMLDRLFEIYHNDYGVKYASPGEVAAEALAGDVRRWGFSHDATTLGGNSGSAIINLQTVRLQGLHFGGAPLRRNLAHDLAKVRDAARAEGMIDPAIFERLSW